MQENEYKTLSTQEIRELFLCGDINLEIMNLEDYERLFGYESDLANPNGDILTFCVNGFRQFNIYNVDVSMPSLDKIYKRYYRDKNKNICIRIAKKTSIAAAITIIVISLTQIVSLAFGFNILEYVFNWLNKETLEITREDNNDIDEFINIKFNNIDDIDKKWSSLISPYLINHYLFSDALYINMYGDESFIVNFDSENEKLLKLIITNASFFQVEKDESDNPFHEIMYVNSIEFNIFNNMEDYQVVWIKDGYVYTLNTFLPLETVKEIINNYY